MLVVSCNIERNLAASGAEQGNGEFFLSYANGKSIARIINGLTADSPHRFGVSGDQSARFSETTSTDGVLLHFPLSRPLDLSHRAQRSCNITNISVSAPGFTHARTKVFFFVFPCFLTRHVHALNRFLFGGAGG